MAAEPTRLTQRAGILGLAFVVLFVVGFLVGGQTPDYDAPDEEWVSWFDDSGNRGQYLVATFVLVLAAMALVGFSAVVSTALRLRSPDGGSLGSLALASGTAAAIFIALAAIITAAMAGALTFAPEYDEVPSAELLKAIEQVGFGIWLIGGGWAAALFVATVSAGARATGLFAGWLAVAGYVIAALLLLSVMFVPFVLFLLWMLIVSILLVRSGASDAVSPAV